MALRVGSVTPRFVQVLVLSPGNMNAQTAQLQWYNVPGLQGDMFPMIQQEVLDANYVRAESARIVGSSGSANGVQLEICWKNWGNGNSASVAGSSQNVRLVCF